MGEISRWAGGVSLIPEGAGWLVHTPAEEFLVVEPEPGRPADLRAPELLEVFTEEGVLEPARTARSGPVGVSGDGPLAEQLAVLLEYAGFDVVRGSEEELLEQRPLVLVSAPSWLPDRHWSELEPQVIAACVPWHRAYAEGGRWYVGPFWTGPGDSAHGDVRIRRLAASAWPEQLRTYWQWLDDGGRPEPDPAAPAGAAAAAGFLAADLLAWQAGQAPGGRNVQVGIDLGKGVVRRHPVLPVPAGLMHEVPA